MKCEICKDGIWENEYGKTSWVPVHIKCLDEQKGDIEDMENEIMEYGELID